MARQHPATMASRGPLRHLRLAGADTSVLRFGYVTDPGLARPGWFIDDVAITATLPDGTTEIYATDFETRRPRRPAIFPGGCQSDGPGSGTAPGSRSFAAAADGSPADHAYYLELRDRSGFDLDGHGQSDRGELSWVARRVARLHRRGVQLRQRQQRRPARPAHPGRGPEPGSTSRT